MKIISNLVTLPAALATHVLNSSPALVHVQYPIGGTFQIPKARPLVCIPRTLTPVPCSSASVHFWHIAVSDRVWLPVSGEEFVDPVDRMAMGQSLQHVGNPGLGIDVIELGGGDKGADRCPPLGTALESGEEVVLAPERYRADGAFDRGGVKVDPAIVEEASERGPAGARICARQNASRSLCLPLLRRAIAPPSGSRSALIAAPLPS